MTDTAKHILFSALCETHPTLLEAIRCAAKSGIPAAKLKRVVKTTREYKEGTRVAPGAILAAIEVIYEQEKQLPAAPRGGTEDSDKKHATALLWAINTNPNHSSKTLCAEHGIPERIVQAAVSAGVIIEIDGSFCADQTKGVAHIHNGLNKAK